ncbi:NAD-dependent epimerase/dehydratase family protein [Legionella sp. D16C41]|uniref:NAD-dependent epimerase/dehydratase family protein n=1 Tax=Legionella sp. D16C41 TaxID=3402688 RepID=UPI003AF559ED
MKSVLITGGMGFIGNFLSHRLLSLGIRVTILDKSIYRPTYCDITNAQVIEGDVLSKELLKECLSKVDACIHLAATTSISACAKDWLFSHENNVIAFNGLLDVIRKMSRPIRLVYASSAAVYGNEINLPLTEAQAIKPCSAYGADKLSNEIYAEIAHQTFKINPIGLRFFNVYGPGQGGNNYSSVITSFNTAIVQEKPLIIFGNGKQTRDFIYIDDVVDGILAAVLSPVDTYGVFNICSGKAISILELAQIMLKMYAKKVPIYHEKPRKGDLYYSLGSTDLAKEKLKFTAKTCIEDGLRYFIESASSKFNQNVLLSSQTLNLNIRQKYT